MRRAAIFVLSDVRSGSTLLDQCLGAHPDVVSLGEVHWLQAYLSRNRRLYDPEHPLDCTCGRAVAACPFWMDVAARLGRPLETLQLHIKFKALDTERSPTSLIGRIPRHLYWRAPRLFRFHGAQRLFAGPRMARDSVDLFDAVEAATGRPICVDSSKSTLRFRCVHDLQPDKTRAVVLSRDYRAVVHSKVKRGARLEIAAAGWRRKMHQIDALTSDLPREHIHFVTYESLCRHPQAELTRLCEFLGIGFSEKMLYRPMADMHHIGGSPSKFDAARIRIELDLSYVDKFSQADLERLHSIVGDQAARWGY